MAVAVYTLQDGVNRQVGGRQELTPTCHSAISARAARAAGLTSLLRPDLPAPRGGTLRRGHHPTPDSRPMRPLATRAQPFPIPTEEPQVAT